MHWLGGFATTRVQMSAYVRWYAALHPHGRPRTPVQYDSFLTLDSYNVSCASAADRCSCTLLFLFTNSEIQFKFSQESKSEISLPDSAKNKKKLCFGQEPKSEI